MTRKKAVILNNASSHQVKNPKVFVGNRIQYNFFAIITRIDFRGEVLCSNEAKDYHSTLQAN